MHPSLSPCRCHCPNINNKLSAEPAAPRKPFLVSSSSSSTLFCFAFRLVLLCERPKQHCPAVVLTIQPVTQAAGCFPHLHNTLLSFFLSFSLYFFLSSLSSSFFFFLSFLFFLFLLFIDCAVGVRPPSSHSTKKQKKKKKKAGEPHWRPWQCPRPGSSHAHQMCRPPQQQHHGIGLVPHEGLPVRHAPAHMPEQAPVTAAPHAASDQGDGGAVAGMPAAAARSSSSSPPRSPICLRMPRRPQTSERGASSARGAGVPGRRRCWPATRPAAAPGRRPPPPPPRPSACSPAAAPATGRSGKMMSEIFFSVLSCGNNGRM